MSRHDRFCASFARSVQVWAAVFTGDLRRAVALGVESVRIAEPLHEYLTVGTNTTNLAWARGVAGDVEEGLRLMEAVVRSVRDAGPDVDVVGLSVTVAKLHLWGGDLEGALEWFERAAHFAAPGPENWIAVRALPGLAGTLRRLGRLDEAGQHADRGVELATELEVPHALAEAIEETALLVAGDDPGRAEDLHHQALRIRVDHGLWTFVVDSLDALAGLATSCEGFAEAARLLSASDVARQRMGHPRPVVDHPDHDATWDRLGAGLGDDALAAARAEGAPLSLADTVAYASRSRGARQRPSFGWSSLTPTEREVVALVAQGLTNPEVASRLFVSRATVKTHLSHVFTKLGVANRTELAWMAIAQQATGATSRP